MPVNLNTGNNTYAVNSSRIQKFITADNRADALRMGGWDRFKDLFRADTDKKATKIAQIYDSIVGAASGDRQPLTMLNRFHALKAMAATPADRTQFTTTYTAPTETTPTWGYAFSIGDTRIHEQNGVEDVFGSLGQTFEKTMLVKELEHHLDPLAETFEQSEANRQIDQNYGDGKVSIMATRAGDDPEGSKSSLSTNLDNPLCSRSNFKGLELRDNGQTMVATFEKGGESLSLHFNANNDPRDPLMPCGDTLKRWLQDADYLSIRNLIETKAKSPDDNKSVNDFKGHSLKAIQDAYAAVGKPVDAMALMNGSVQNDLANMIREVHQENPESAQPVMAKLFNMSIAGFTDTDPDFAVRNFLGDQFCKENRAYLDAARHEAYDLRAQLQDGNLDAEGNVVQNRYIPPVPNLSAAKTEADNFLASHLVNYRKMNILGTEVGGGARPAGDYLRDGATQEDVLANIKAAGFTTILSIDQNKDSRLLTEPIQRAGLKHEIGNQYKFPDWEHAPPGLYQDIKQFIEEKTAQGERVFIHCGAGNGRTGATLAALTLSDLIDKETRKRAQIGQSFDQFDYRSMPKVSIETQFEVVVGDEAEDLELLNKPPIKEKTTSWDLPYIAAHAVQAVRDAVKDTAYKADAVETNHQLWDVTIFGGFLLPPGPIDPSQFA
jgi:hypothetical protein